MTNVFRLFGEIAINNAKANKAIGDTTSFAKKAKNEINKTFSSIGKAAVSCGKVVASGLAVGGAAVGAFLKTTIGEYAAYEQLVGGIETLFKESKGTVMGYANEAYKTAGMSANEYMETITGFSASLLQGLGGDTELAAEYAHMAITDMADNANKMGTSMESIQYAYAGFAKQNYTMLDNLKLGYGGTQAEMARLINESGVLGSAITVTADTVNQVSFDKIIKAINIIQGRMEITGTTAEEASGTISGSFSTFKATWRNLMTGLASGDQDINVLMGNFVNAGTTLKDNIVKVLPTIGSNIVKVLASVGQLIDTEMANNIWPAIQSWFKFTFDVELPDWEGVKTAIEIGWTSYIKPAIDGVTTWLKDNIDSVKAVLKATAFVLGGMFLMAHPLVTLLASLGGAFALLNTDVDPANTTLVNVKSALEDIKKWIDENKSAVMAALAALGIAFLALNAPLAILIGVVAIVIANWEGLKTIVENVATAINDFFTITLPAWWEDKIVTPIKTAWQTVVDIVNTAIKAVERFFGIGGESPFKDTVFAQAVEGVNTKMAERGVTFGEPEVKKNAKGAVFSRPTIFDTRIGYQMVGEAGAEAVAPISVLQGYVSQAVRAETNGLQSVLNQLLGVMNQVAVNTASGQQVVLDSGVLVGQIATKVDTKLGSLASRKGRGN